MQPRKKSYSVNEGTGESGVKRRSVYSGKAILPGKEKPRTSNAEISTSTTTTNGYNRL